MSYTVEQVAGKLREGYEFSAQEIDDILLYNGMPEDTLQEFHDKGYSNDQLLGLLRY